MKRRPGEPRARDGADGRSRSTSALRTGPRATERARAAEPAPVPGVARAAWILAATLGTLALLRGALALAPSMWLWGLNVLAFVAPLPGWATWALATLALAPPLGRRLVPGLERAGDAIADRPGLASVALGALLAVVVLLFPDRLQLVGDYLLRVGTALGQIPADTVFPQALPLDLALHYAVPSRLALAFGGDPNNVSRAIGAIEAALFGGLAVAFAHTLRLRGAAAAAAAAVVAFGGALGMFTGFAKVFSELCLIAAAFGVLGITVVRDGVGLTTLSLAVGAGLTLHRSALAFLPPLVVVWALWLRAHGGGGVWRRPASLAAFAIPPLTLAFMLPRIRAAIESTDRSHFARAGSDLPHVLGAAFRGLHLADLGNLLLLLSPLALAAPALAARLAPSLWRRPEAVVLGALLVPFAGLLLFVHPRQGQFRDWDVFTAAGVVVSLVTAWLVGETLRGGTRSAWLAAAVVLGALAPSLQWLMHNHDPRRGMSRVEAYVAGPPTRGGEERALLYNFLALRHEAFNQLDAAAESYARAAELAPSPRIVMEWSMAESNRGNYAAAQRILQGLVERSPDMIMAWSGLAYTSYKLGDTAECRRAAESALRIRPDLKQPRDLLKRLASPGGVDGAPGR
jgi:tetratricopeptide (TPR) repeat protein